MNADRVIAVLKSALESGQIQDAATSVTATFQFWFRKQQAETTSDLTKSLENELTRWELVSAHFRDTVLFIGRDQTGLSIASLARWLLAKTREVGPDEAVGHLNHFLMNDDFEGNEKLAVIGARIQSPVELGNGIFLKTLPFYDQVDSPHLATINNYVMSNHMHDPQNHLPITALVCRSRHRKMLIKIGSASNPAGPYYESRLDDLIDANRFLTLVSDYACPVPIGYWWQADTTVPCAHSKE